VSGAGQGGGGGEYELQDGFGWTNGVTLKLLEKYGVSAESGSH
jgi:alpha,alpha-trehalase